MSELCGVLPIDKPPGMTSRDVVNVFQRILRPSKTKVGHTGTLDPLATGVLLLAVGRATRLVEYSHEALKEYQATFQLGLTSPSLDIETEVTQVEGAAVVDAIAMRHAAQNMEGWIRQRPPAYSAIHVDGKRAYDLARAGQNVDIPEREIYISELEINNVTETSFDLRTVCSTGTYIRTLGDDIARVCGSRAVMSKLRRTQVGPFAVADCKSIEGFSSVEDIAEKLLAPLGLVQHMPRLTLDATELEHVRNGRRIDREMQCIVKTGACACRPSKSNDSPAIETIAAIDGSGALAGILSAKDDYWRADKVFVTNTPTSPPSKTSTPQSAES